MVFRLSEDRIAVLADEVKETTASGLVVPDSGQDPLRYGTVMIIGVGHRSEQTGNVIPLDFLVGDRVFFHRASGQPMEIEGVEYVILSPREIIGVTEVQVSYDPDNDPF